MKDQKLSGSEIEDWLSRHPDWKLDEGKLYRELSFKDFKQAFSWMSRIGLWAEQQNHHPEWFNVYSKVKVWLTTHDLGGVGPKDIALAEEINESLENPYKV
ncbi:MAG: 4a-hydroxytetrahydrobiopterin dehydratase [Bradymonadales bacterium]|nr:MAG: 4a-hydroxytetrahydrobiopterin dehydratase [Bradymonadales bacterium]